MGVRYPLHRRDFQPREVERNRRHRLEQTSPVRKLQVLPRQAHFLCCQTLVDQILPLGVLEMLRRLGGLHSRLSLWLRSHYCPFHLVQPGVACQLGERRQPEEHCHHHIPEALLRSHHLSIRQEVRLVRRSLEVLLHLHHRDNLRGGHLVLIRILGVLRHHHLRSLRVVRLDRNRIPEVRRFHLQHSQREVHLVHHNQEEGHQLHRELQAVRCGDPSRQPNRRRILPGFRGSSMERRTRIHGRLLTIFHPNVLSRTLPQNVWRTFQRRC